MELMEIPRNLVIYFSTSNTYHRNRKVAKALDKNVSEHQFLPLVYQYVRWFIEMKHLELVRKQRTNTDNYIKGYTVVKQTVDLKTTCL